MIDARLRNQAQARGPYRRLRVAIGIRWWLLALLVVVMDQIVKLVVQDAMPYGMVIPVLTFVNLVHIWNTGAAFSLLADAGGGQRYLLIGIASTVSLWLAIALCRPLPRFEAAAYALILGGALGNVADRIIRGYVVDYLDVYWRQWHWPAFNIADVSIITGAALLVAGGLRASRRDVTG